MVTEVSEQNDQKTHIEQTKEYLKSYKRLCKKLQSLDEQMRSTRESKESAKTQYITDMPKGGVQTDLSDYIVELDDLYTKIIRLRKECIRKKIEIESRIADLPDGIESMILHMKYIEDKHWEEICVVIGYEWAQTHRKHSDALHHFQHDTQ